MKIFLLSISLIIYNFGFGQAIEIKQIQDAEIVRLLNSAVVISTNKTNDLSFKVYTLGNEPGSAGYANGGIVA